MNSNAVKYIFAVLIILHGIGHGMGILPVLGIRLSSRHSWDSWLFRRFLSENGLKTVLTVLSLMSFAAFLSAGLSIAGWIVSPLFRQHLLISASSLSLISLAIFWDSYPFLFPNKMGVMLVDILLIWSVFTGKLSSLPI